MPPRRTQPLAVQSRYGYLWVCPSGRPARPLFAFPEYTEPGRRTVDCGGIGVAVSGLRVIENFLDMAHFPFVHADYLGKVPHTEVAPYQVDMSIPPPARSGRPTAASGSRAPRPRTTAAPTCATRTA
jgi:phenylpropionate dioxygenase-like ring-hydroxylating dioxygenase large terminal subunit